jgi:hypothetical protein
VQGVKDDGSDIPILVTDCRIDCTGFAGDYVPNSVEIENDGSK